MATPITIQIQLPDDLKGLCLPPGVNRRLHELLDKQDQGPALSVAEREEAQGLADLAEFLTLLRLRTERAKGEPGA